MEILENSIWLPGERNIESIIALNEVLIQDRPKEEDIKDNVIAILGLNGNGYTNCGGGLVLTDDGFVLTAGHVVKDYFPVWDLVKPNVRLEDLEKVFFVMDKKGNKFPIDPTFAYHDSSSDLAVIRSIKTDRPKPKSYRLNKSLSVGEELSLIAPESVDYRRGLELNETSREIYGFGNNQIFLKGFGKSGQSGSPYLSQNGELAGIHLGINGLGSYAANPEQIGAILQSTIDALRQSYKDVTGYDPLSKRRIPTYLHNVHRANVIADAKKRIG